MVTFIQWFLYICALLTAALSIFFSIQARMSKDTRRRGLMSARMNICMGLMLITIATIQVVLFQSSTVRIIIGVVFYLLGFFNLFAGIRNHAIFNRH